MARAFFEKMTGSRLIMDSMNDAQALALYLEAEKRGIPVEIISKRDIRKSRAKALGLNFLWFSNEIVRTLFRTVKRRPARDKSKMVFFFHGAKFYASLRPVIAEIAEKSSGKVAIIAKGETANGDRSPTQTGQPIDFDDFRDFKYLGKLLQCSFRIRKELHKHLSCIARQPGPSLFREPRYLGYLFKTWFQDTAYRSIRSVLLADRALERLQPGVVIVADPTDYVTKAFTLTGRTRGVSSFCIQFGMASKYDSEWRYFKQDYLGVMGAEIAAIMKNNGIPEERIYVLGNPRYDSYFPDDHLKDRVRKDLNVPDSHVLVAFMSVPPVTEGIGKREAGLSLQEYETILAMVYELPDRLENMVLAVKPHPEEFEYIEYHKTFMGAEGPRKNRIRLIQNRNAYEIMNASDLVITMQSTTGLEAILLEKPLIMVNITDREDYVNYASSGAACRVSRREGLVPAVQSLLHDHETAEHFRRTRKQYLKENLGYMYQSARRSADVLLGLIH